MKKRIITIIFILILFSNFIFANNSISDDISKELDINHVISSLNQFVDSEINFEDFEDDLVNGNPVDYGAIVNFLYEKIFKEIITALKSSIQILIIIILIAIINSLELDKKNSITTVASLVGFLLIVGITIKNYAVILKLFVSTIDIITNIIQVVSPFLFAILIATGEIATSGIISPIILFVTSLLGTVTSYIVIPLMTLSLVFNIISNLSDRIKLEKFSKICSSSSLWILAIIFSVFLGLLELEGSISTSVDSVTVKAAETAVSNVIPVVGKFVSDSLEVVMGSTEVIGKSIGVIGIICLVIVSLIPLIKFIIFSLIYFLLASFSEMLDVDLKITKFLEGMNKLYKTLIGIMIGTSVTFIISTALIINLIGKVYS